MPPDRINAATLAIPSVENRLTASRPIDVQPWRRHATSRSASGTRPPTQVDAAVRCRASLARCRYPNLKGVDPACPVQAMEATRHTAAANASRRKSAIRSKIRQIASATASIRRTSDARPNWVSSITAESAPDVMASLKPRPLIDTVCSQSQTRPETTAMATPIHAMPRIWRSISAPARRNRAQSRPRHEVAEHQRAGNRRRGGEVDRPYYDHRAFNLRPEPTHRLSRKPHCPTSNVKLPSVVWVSADSTCHITW